MFRTLAETEVKNQMSREMSKTAKMDKKLLKRVDNAVKTIKNELNQKRFCDRRDFLDQAVRKFLISYKTN